MGIEQAFNKTLAGQNGYKDAQYDVYGYKLPGKQQKEKAVKNGNNVYTTIDSRIQTLLESEMNSVQSQVHAAGMNAVLMDAKTGKIVAASQRPTFNAATLKGIGSAWTNTLSSDMYEPGSTMKVFTLSSAIDSGHYNGTDTYESGRYSIDGKIVPDWNPAGWGYITYNKGFALSSNVAMAHLEQQMGPKTWKKYIHRFGFLKSTNSGLPGELTGRIQFNYPIEQADTSFGQGIEVTTMQMMQALSAVSNNGTMMKPYFISKITNPSNTKTIKKYGKKKLLATRLVLRLQRRSVSICRMLFTNLTELVPTTKLRVTGLLPRPVQLKSAMAWAAMLQATTAIYTRLPAWSPQTTPVT